MNSDVQKSVNAKTNYFDEYLIVPDGLRPEVDAFCAEVVALGEQCADFNTFEDRFASEGLSEKFVALICQCAQKSSPQTKEQRRESLKTAKSMMRENRKETAEYLADSVLTSARIEAEGRILKENRERMIENDTMGDYTRTKNAIEDGISLFGFLLNKFKKWQELQNAKPTLPLRKCSGSTLLLVRFINQPASHPVGKNGTRSTRNSCNSLDTIGAGLSFIPNVRFT